MSAPSPMLGSSVGNDGRMPGIAEEEGVSTTGSIGVGSGGVREPVGVNNEQGQRILISMSKLHNPGGRTSFICW